MNPFFDISPEGKSAENHFQLDNLGSKIIYLTTVARKSSEFWDTRGKESKNFYRATTDKDYDQQFVNKLKKWEPVYTIDKLLEHHYQHYVTHNPQNEDFLKHMRYIILPKIKSKNETTSLSELFEQWLELKMISKNKEEADTQIVHNHAIYISNLNAPAQFQQNSDHSIQTQNNQPEAEKITLAFDLIRKDIQAMDAKIREDFDLEMHYAVSQLSRGNDVTPQLSKIGRLIREIGVSTFASLIAAPVFEYIKSYLGLFQK